MEEVEVAGVVAVVGVVCVVVGVVEWDAVVEMDECYVVGVDECDVDVEMDECDAVAEALVVGEVDNCVVVGPKGYTDEVLVVVMENCVADLRVSYIVVVVVVFVVGEVVTREELDLLVEPKEWGYCFHFLPTRVVLREEGEEENRNENYFLSLLSFSCC